MYRPLLVGAIALILVVAPAGASDVGPCQVFPPDTVFRADISALPKHRNSDAWIRNMKPTKTLSPDFALSTGATLPVRNGIPWTTVTNAQPNATISFTNTAESDAGPYPIPGNAQIERGPGRVDRDQHRHLHPL